MFSWCFGGEITQLSRVKGKQRATKKLPERYMRIIKAQSGLRPTMTQISLRIRAVWSESLLSVRRNSASFAILSAHREDSDQTVRMHRLNWILAGRTCPKIHFLMVRLVYFLCISSQTRLYNFDPFKTPLLYSKTGVYRGKHYFSYFAKKTLIVGIR